MPEIERRLSDAIKHFWSTRTKQSVDQGRSGRRDTGSRSAVTGGRQMDGFISLVREVLIESGCPEHAVFMNRRVELPGWFRAEKQWDLIVVHKNQLIAAVEFKSQVGPSFGNNFNNRTEEAIGSATDIWAAYREGAFKPSARPWIGYFMLLEDCEASNKPVGVTRTHFPVFAEFEGASYATRYRLLIQKLLRDRLYDGAAFLVSDARGGLKGRYSEPDPEAGFDHFLRSIAGHVGASCKTGRFGC